MCAIAGLLACAELLQHIRRMTALMAHRGPDGEGFLFRGPTGTRLCPGAGFETGTAGSAGSSNLAQPSPGEWLALGHRRLAILDLSSLGQQPMSYQGRYWIVYNGEVFNY